MGDVKRDRHVLSTSIQGRGVLEANKHVEDLPKRLLTVSEGML